MMLFSHFPKSAFWSHILLGMVAVFALPSLPNIEPNEAAERVEQRLNFAELKKAETEQTFFLQQEQPNRCILPLQAVEFCEFFAKPYRLLSFTQPPIRAGPVV